MKRTPVTRFSVDDDHFAHDRVLHDFEVAGLAAPGIMWTSAELYLATTSQPAMQLPQKWQAGRVPLGRDNVDLRT